MFVFDDIANLTDREIQMVLREVDSKELAMALKGANDRLKDRFVSNMSDRVAGMLKEDIEFMGPVRMSDVEDVQLRIVQTIRQLEDAGQVTVVRGDVNDVFV
jgi:flagellar motor switch protein FliG